MGVQVYRRMIEKGVLARAAGNVIAFCPAYVISENDLETVLLTAREALDELT
jgi:adenosylmethionine-8-amino-7-oxononanoate aminotransferase